MAVIEIIPSARRMMSSLRSMGYDFSQAVADLVDNSIEADASHLAINVEFDGDDSWVRIVDNGKGMRPDELREALRYGAEREYAPDDLGKFGLGLKTASLSQCRRLSVASRWNPNRGDIAGYCWDLEHVLRTNRWEILPLDRGGTMPEVRRPLKDCPGTVVLWQRLDRMLGYQYPYGEPARKRLSQMCRDLEQHLGMVFHRFISGEHGKRHLTILLNGNEIAPWDPFCRSESKTKKLQTIRLTVEHNGISGNVILEPFVLPPQNDFSSPTAFQQASGPANWNQQQGLYIYRAGRMIQSGGWSRLRTPDEHTKLARVAMHFSPNLDEAFKVNVAKMRAQIPQQLREEIRHAIVPVVKLAREIYDRKATKAPPTSGRSTGNATKVAKHLDDSTAAKAQSVMSADAANGSSLLERLTLDEWGLRALAAAASHERPIIKSVIARIRKDSQK